MRSYGELETGEDRKGRSETKGQWQRKMVLRSSRPPVVVCLGRQGNNV